MSTEAVTPPSRRLVAENGLKQPAIGQHLPIVRHPAVQQQRRVRSRALASRGATRRAAERANRRAAARDGHVPRARRRGALALSAGLLRVADARPHPRLCRRAARGRGRAARWPAAPREPAAHGASLRSPGRDGSSPQVAARRQRGQASAPVSSMAASSRKVRCWPSQS